MRPYEAHPDLPRAWGQALVPSVDLRLQRDRDHDGTPTGENPRRRRDFHRRSPPPAGPKPRPHRTAVQHRLNRGALRLAERAAAVQVDADWFADRVGVQPAPGQTQRLPGIWFIGRRIVPVHIDVDAVTAFAAPGNLRHRRRVAGPAIDRGGQTRRDPRAEIADLRAGGGDDSYGMWIVGVIRLTPQHQRITWAQRLHGFLPALEC